MNRVLLTALLILGVANVARAQLANSYANATTTGTTLNSLAKLNTSNQAVIATTSDTAVRVFVVVGGAGTSGSAQVARVGQALCTMDATNASFASQPIYVVESTTTGGDCSATTTAPTAGTYVVGFLAATSTTSGSTAFVDVDGFFMPPSSGGTAVNKVSLTAQAATISATAIITPSSAGDYRATCTTILTQAATTSSQMPGCEITWTDADSGVVESVSLTSNNTTNTVGAMGGSPVTELMHVKASTAIQYKTATYSSSGATAMQFSLYLVLEGPF